VCGSGKCEEVKEVQWRGDDIKRKEGQTGRHVRVKQQPLLRVGDGWAIKGGWTGRRVRGKEVRWVGGGKWECGSGEKN